MRIYLENFRFKTIIGILDFERESEQVVQIDLQIEYNYNRTDFIDYVELKEYIKSCMRREKFGLIEDALLYFEESLHREFKVDYLKLKIQKPDILPDSDVAVEIERSF
jgi:dihydroneopterin aldolase